MKNILFNTNNHIVIAGEEMVEIIHIHEKNKRNNFVETLDMAIEKIIKEEKGE
uniref:Phage protein n=1 Tax=viral metagenome TaxID=1070528 RepID=A0A6M3LE60_9ZZZZ